MSSKTSVRVWIPMILAVAMLFVAVSPTHAATISTHEAAANSALAQTCGGDSGVDPNPDDGWGGTTTYLTRLLVNDCQTHDIVDMLANGTPAATICSYIQTNVPDAASYSCDMWNNVVDFSANNVAGVDAMWPAHKGVYFDFYSSSGASVKVWNQWWNY